MHVPPVRSGRGDAAILVREVSGDRSIGPFRCRVLDRAARLLLGAPDAAPPASAAAPARLYLRAGQGVLPGLAHRGEPAQLLQLADYRAGQARRTSRAVPRRVAR